MSDPIEAQLSVAPLAGGEQPPKIIRFVHVAAHGDAHMAWAIEWVNIRIVDLEAEIIAIAHAVDHARERVEPLYSTVIAYSCPAYAPPVPPIPPYAPGG